MVEAGGAGIFTRIENTQLIEKSRRRKIRKLRNCAHLERIWNAAFSFAHQHFDSLRAVFLDSQYASEAATTLPRSLDQRKPQRKIHRKLKIGRASRESYPQAQID